MTIGERIKKARKDKGLTQKKLAEKIFVVPEALSRWEKGRRHLSAQTLCDIADALEMSIDELVGRSEYGKH